MLMGSNEVPTNHSYGYRNSNLTILQKFCYSNDLSSITGGHIHKGTAGTNGGVVFPFTALVSISYTSALTAEQEADLWLLYYIKCTLLRLLEEIRGQLVKGTTTIIQGRLYRGGY
jgi:hypothetical protein